MYGISRVGISSMSSRRIKGLSQANRYKGINAFSGSRINTTNKKYKNMDYSDRMKALENLFRTNTLKITNKDSSSKISKGVEVLFMSEDGEKRLQDKVINLKVSQLAKTQINSSSQLVSTSKSIKPGDYEFEINIKDKKYIGKVQVKDGENNEDILKKLSASINVLNCGIKSDVLKDKNGVVVLHLTSNQTGNDGSFKIKDIKSNIISNLKLDIIKQVSQNAQYSIDNKTYESATNEISIEGGMAKLKINSQGNYSIDINKKRCYEAIQANSEEIASNLDFFTNYYNNKILYTPKNTFTYDKLTGEFRDRESSFNNVGIEALQDNSMRFEKRNFKNLARTNPEAFMSSMISPKGVMNFFNMVKSSDLNRQSSTYGVRGRSRGIYRLGGLVNY